MTQKNKILIIEDNQEMRENICEILELAGYAVQAAKDGLDGVQNARQHQPDLILCDIMMPNLDGFGVLKILQKDDNLNNIPFIFLTAKAEREDFRKGMNLGAEDYLLKPFEDYDLLQVIENKLLKYQDLARNNTSKILSGLISFKEFEDITAVKELIKTSPGRECIKKTRLWNPDENINQIYYLEQGMVKEVINTVGAKEFVTDFYDAPDFTGIKYLFQSRYPGYCELIETGIVKSIPKKQLEEIILKENLWSSFIQYTNQLSMDYIHRLSVNSFGNVREKVAYHLNLLSQKLNQSSLNLSREDLAAYCGIAKETLIRTLTEFKDEKLIRMDGEGLAIMQPQKLNALFQ